MFLRRFQHVLMDAAAGAEGGHSSGGAGTPPDDRTGNAGAPAPAAAAPGAAPNALAAATQPGPHDHIPEKFRVLAADGSLDLDATLRKNAEAYTALEKRMGQGGDEPPAAVTDYKITPPETLKDAFSPEDPSFKAFLDKAHGAKLTQAQLDVVMGAFFETAPKLVGGAAALDADACMAELGKDWKTPDALHSNFVAADRAIQQLGGGAADALRQKYGNDPDFLRFAATVGAQLKEDRAPGGASVTSAEDIAALERSEAYRNAKHPDHEKVSRQVREHYQRVAEATPGMIV
ncbi:MAG TPA: hypothetical protein VGE10_11110 [Zeimonas sp.]